MSFSIQRRIFLNRSWAHRSAPPKASVTRTAPSCIELFSVMTPLLLNTTSMLPPPMSTTAAVPWERSNTRATLRCVSLPSSRGAHQLQLEPRAVLDQREEVGLVPGLAHRGPSRRP